MRSMPKAHHIASAVAAFVLVSTLSSAPAQVVRRPPPREPDAAAGRVLAESLCIGCHLIRGEEQGQTVPAGVPSFASIARRAGQTPMGIAGGIVVPHPPMPDIPLTRDEIADLAAYVFTLRDP